MSQFSSGLRFNPMKYYISIRNKKNFAYIQLRKVKVRMVIMLKEEIVRSAIKHHTIVPLSEGVQKFYGSPCCQIIIENEANVDEVIDILKKASIK